MNADSLLTDEACEALYSIGLSCRISRTRRSCWPRSMRTGTGQGRKRIHAQGIPFGEEHEGTRSGGRSVSKVGHICRVVKDSEVAKKFYTNIIGAKLLNRPKFPTNGYWLWLGNTQLHLIESELAMAPDHPKGGTRVNHISFDCYDFDAVEQKIKEAGIKYNKVYVPLGTDSGINQIFVQDPDFHWIEICDCHRFNDFIFGEYDEKRGEELRKAYLEGVEPKGTFMATLLTCSWHKAISRAILHIRKCSILFAGTDGDSATISEDDVQLVLGRLMGRER